MDFVQPDTGKGESADNLSVFALIKHKLFKKTSRSNRKPRNLARVTIISAIVILLGCAAFVGWKHFIWQPANVNPFTPQLSASLQFPLFHPTYVPVGFRVDTKSVTEPATGVVVFSLDGPKNEKIYISEEARPTKYDIGGFFTKFSDLKETAITGGTLATGEIDNGSEEVSSMLNNQVWIICNTNAPVPMDQMSQLAKDLSSNAASS